MAFMACLLCRRFDAGSPAFQVRTELAASQLELTEERQALEEREHSPEQTTSPRAKLTYVNACKCKITLTAIASWPFTLLSVPYPDSSLQGQKKAE